MQNVSSIQFNWEFLRSRKYKQKTLLWDIIRQNKTKHKKKQMHFLHPHPMHNKY